MTLTAFSSGLMAANNTEGTLIHPGPNGKLIYHADKLGDVIPDFSSCGYMGGGVAIPDAIVRVTLASADAGDDGQRIQGALDQVGHLPADAAQRPQPRVVATLPICVTNDAAAIRDRITRTSGMYAQLPSYQAMFAREGAEHPGDLGLVGSEAEVEHALGVLSDAGVTDFAASEFTPSPEEKTRTRALLKRLNAH